MGRAPTVSVMVPSAKPKPPLQTLIPSAGVLDSGSHPPQKAPQLPLGGWADPLAPRRPPTRADSISDRRLRVSLLAASLDLLLQMTSEFPSEPEVKVLCFPHSETSHPLLSRGGDNAPGAKDRGSALEAPTGPRGKSR